MGINAFGSLTNYLNYNASKGVGTGTAVPYGNINFGPLREAEGSKQTVSEPKVGLAYSAEDYEAALEAAQKFASNDFGVAGHQGIQETGNIFESEKLGATNPSEVVTTAWLGNGGAPVNQEGNGFYDGEVASKFDRIG